MSRSQERGKIFTRKNSEYKVFMDFSFPLGLTTKLIFYHEIFLGSTCIICVADFRPRLEISGYLFYNLFCVFSRSREA